MQDEKLARGLARQLIKNIKRFFSPDGGVLLEISNDLITLYREGGPANVVGYGLSLQKRFALIKGCNSTAQKIEHPIRKRIVIATMRPVIVDGDEQAWLNCGACLFDIGRHEVGVVETSGGIGVSQHAIARLFQRTKFSDENVGDLLDKITLFAAPMIRACFERQWLPGQQVAIPFLEGLLLGTIEGNFHEEGQGPSFCTIGRMGVSNEVILDCAHSISAAERLTVKICLHTYVGDYDLFPNQKAICHGLEKFSQTYITEMRAIRTDVFRGYPDATMVERFGLHSHPLDGVRLSDLNRLMQSFYDTDEWKQHVHASRQVSRREH